MIERITCVVNDINVLMCLVHSCYTVISVTLLFQLLAKHNLAALTCQRFAIKCL